MTRNFVVVCHNTSDKAAWGQFDPNNLLAGRVDVWCRVISNALYYSDGIRKTVRVWLLLHPTGGLRSHQSIPRLGNIIEIINMLMPVN